MDQAIKAVNEGMSRNQAAKTFGVPVTTLSDKVGGRTCLDRKMGAPTVLTSKEEERLVE